MPSAEGVLDLGDLACELGGTIRDAKLSWQTYGTLNVAGDNAIVYPCSYTATAEGQNWCIEPGGILDPDEWFVVVPDMFSNGKSSSAADSDDWPEVVTAGDNVRAQRRLLDHLGVQHVAAVYGFSMGAIQAYHWASLYPSLVERAIVVCGSARTAEHNQVFLQGLLRILEAAPEHLGGGRFSAEPEAAKAAFGTVYAAWGLSQDFYREQLYKGLGARDWQTFVQTDWVDGFVSLRAADLYAQAQTWLHADIALGRDLPAALAAIEARVLLLPSETDLYFRVADNAAELPHLRHGELQPIPSRYGHRAGSPAGLPDELAFVTSSVREWLAG